MTDDYTQELALSLADAADPTVRHLWQALLLDGPQQCAMLCEGASGLWASQLVALDAWAVAAAYDLFRTPLLEDDGFWALVRNVRRWSLVLEAAAVHAAMVPVPPRAGPQTTTLEDLAHWDHTQVARADQLYGGSWRSRGGVGAYMVGIRKWDRLQTPLAYLKTASLNTALGHPVAGPSVWDDLVDLRRYLLLWEGERLRSTGCWLASSTTTLSQEDSV